jgi:hypothetical protein
MFDWPGSLQALHTSAKKVKNSAAAHDDLVVIARMNITHHAEHAEELNGTLHRVFGWGDGGLLSVSSSREDFLNIYGFLKRFYEAEKDEPPKESCLGLVEARFERVLRIW